MKENDGKRNEDEVKRVKRTRVRSKMRGGKNGKEKYQKRKVEEEKKC